MNTPKQVNIYMIIQVLNKKIVNKERFQLKIIFIVTQNNND